MLRQLMRDHEECSRRCPVLNPYMANDPFNQYRQIRQELDDLLVPTMCVLQTMTRPRIVTSAEAKDKRFEVKLDVQQFSPEELTVKMVDKDLVIEGKHKEKQDEHGFISRHFVRRYTLTEDIKMDEMTCCLSSDGVLCLCAPRMVEELKSEERTLQINYTGMPAIATDTLVATQQQKSGKGKKGGIEQALKESNAA